MTSKQHLSYLWGISRLDSLLISKLTCGDDCICLFQVLPWSVGAVALFTPPSSFSDLLATAASPDNGVTALSPGVDSTVLPLVSELSVHLCCILSTAPPVFAPQNYNHFAHPLCHTHKLTHHTPTPGGTQIQVTSLLIFNTLLLTLYDRSAWFPRLRVSG